MPDEQTPLRMTLEEQELVVNVLRNYHRDHTGDPEFGEWPQVARELAERFRQQLQPPQRDDTTDLMTVYMVGVAHGQDDKRGTAELVEALEAYFEASDNYMVEQDGYYQEALSNLRAALAKWKERQ